GATLLTDGETPRLLLSGNGPLSPTLYNREGSTKVVVYIANAVVSPGLEPPRADGVILSRLDMKSFTEMGKPHFQFELTWRSPLEPAITSESGSPAMAIALGRAATATTMASATLPASAPLAADPAKTPEPAPAEPAVKVVRVEDVPATVSASAAAPAGVSASAGVPAAAPAAVAAGRDAPPVPVRHAAAGRAATRLSGVSVQVSNGKLVAT